ncbi:MAG TPA: hypothetical protein VK177_12015 [Flavobacteriales bacterium]|nr:hypothetical protein [Flavobacteriales bacterium]
MNTYVDLVGTTESLTAEPCKVCSEKVKCTYQVEQSYIALLFLPLFPTKRTIYRVCSNCSARLKVKPTDQDYAWVNETIPKRFNFKYYWGIVALAGLAFLLWRWYNSVMQS